MWQRKQRRPTLCKMAHGLGHRALWLILEVVTLRVDANEQRQAALWQRAEKLCVPERRTFGPRWQVGAVARTWITKPHRDQRHTPGIVKNVCGKTGPRAQSVAAIVLPRYAARVNFRTRRLPDDDDRRRCTHLHDRARLMRQLTRAHRTPAHVAQQTIESRCHYPTAFIRSMTARETPAATAITPTSLQQNLHARHASSAGLVVGCVQNKGHEQHGCAVQPIINRIKAGEAEHERRDDEDQTDEAINR